MKSPMLYYTGALLAVLGLYYFANPFSGYAEEKAARRMESVLPPGVHVGMPVEDLVKARPKAKRFFIPIDPEPAPVDVKVGEHLFHESLEKHPWFQFVQYVVRDGRVVYVALVGEHQIIADMDAPADGSVEELWKRNRSDMLVHFKEQFGPAHKMELIEREPSVAVKCLTPRFVWEHEDEEITLICSADYEDVRFVYGMLGVTVGLLGEAESMVSAVPPHALDEFLFPDIVDSILPPDFVSPDFVPGPPRRRAP